MKNISVSVVIFSFSFFSLDKHLLYKVTNKDKKCINTVNYLQFYSLLFLFLKVVCSSFTLFTALSDPGSAKYLA